VRTRNAIFALSLSAVAGWSMWFFFQRVLVPYQQADAAVHDRPRGNLSDLYPRWWGAHELLLHHRDPYSPEVTREIQAGYYGRMLDPSRPGDPKDEQGFAYPAYVAFLLAPTIYSPFPEVQRGFVILLWVIAAASVLLWMKALQWRLGPAPTMAIVLLTLGSLPVVQGIKLQQLTLLVAAMLAACVAAIVNGWLLPAGVLLALATVKPQLAWLPALWLMLWTFRDWRSRRRFAWAASVTLSALVIGAQVVLPGWIPHFVAALREYHRYTHNVSVLGWLLTPLGGNIAGVFLFILSAWLCWPLLKEDARSEEFRMTAAMVFALTLVLVPMFAPYNQVLLLPVIFSLCGSQQRWRRTRVARLLVGITALLLFWPWIASIVLMLESIFVPPATVQRLWKLPFLASLMLPILMFVLTAAWAIATRQGRVLERATIPAH
jgi:hypothetical protein